MTDAPDKTTRGTRLLNKLDGFLIAGCLNQPASFGRASVSKYEGTPACWWHIVAPDGSACSLNPAVHTVIEHDDGTITVQPSIVTSTWHGWLTKGEFHSV